MKTNGRIQLFPFFRVAIALILGIVAGESSVGCIPIIGLYATLIGILTAVFLVRKFIFQSVMPNEDAAIAQKNMYRQKSAAHISFD